MMQFLCDRYKYLGDMSKPIGSIICVPGDNRETRRKIKGAYLISGAIS